MKIVSMAFNWVEATARWLSMALIIGLSVMVFVKVLFRYVFNAPIVWSDEVIMLMLLALTYLGAAVAAYQHKHIYVELLESIVSRYNEKAAGVLKTITSLVSIGVLCVIVYFSFKIISFSSDQETDILMLSYSWVYGITTVGIIFIVLLMLKGLFEGLERTF